MSNQRLPGTLVDVESLCQWLGYSRPGDVTKWLKAHSIPHWYGKNGRPCTTQEAINEKMLAYIQPID